MKVLILALALFGVSCAQLTKTKYVSGPRTVRQYVHQYEQPAVTYVRPSVSYVQPSLSTVQRPIAILSQRSDFNFDGNFNYDFQSENGIASQTVGTLKNIGAEQPAQVMSGSYTYTAPDGTPITTNWYADETGFHAEGDHLPRSPPIPEAIARSLDYLRTLPPSKDYQQ